MAEAVGGHVVGHVYCRNLEDFFEHRPPQTTNGGDTRKKRKYTYKARVKAPPKTNLLVKNPVLIGEARAYVDAAEGCYCLCDLNCKSFFVKHAVDGWVETVWALRENVQRQPTHKDRRIMLSKIMVEHWDMPEPRGYSQRSLKLAGHAQIGGKRMCMHFFAKIMDVSKGQLTAVFKDCVALGALNYGNAQRIRRRASCSSASDISWWLTETAKFHDPMPNRSWDHLYFANIGISCRLLRNFWILLILSLIPGATKLAHTWRTISGRGRHRRSGVQGRLFR